MKHKINLHKVKNLFFIVLISCSIHTYGQISRTQIINNALPYTTYTWTANSCNITSWNGIACGGRTVYRAPWVAVGSNTSMPYMWGGWSTTAEHTAAMANCKSAGDACSSGGGGCSGNTSGLNQQCASGHDCSGLVSRAWALASKQGTTTLSGYATIINYSQLQSGDIINNPGSHTRLIRTLYSSNFSADVIEASGADWKTSPRFYSPIQLIGYDAMCPKPSVVIGGCGVAPALNCNNAVTLTCGQNYFGTTVGGNSDISNYACNSWVDSGPERVHTLTTTSTGNITATLSNLGGIDLDVWILGSCNPSNCLGTVSSNSSTFVNAPAGTYYIVVDGYLGASGSYTLNVTGNCGSSLPDLIVGPGSQSVSSTNVTAGSSINAFASEYNAGTSSSGSNSIGLWLSQDASLNSCTDTYLGAISGYPSLSSGATSSILSGTVTIPSSSASGTYYLFFWADGCSSCNCTGIITESDDLNNFVSVQINVSCIPPTAVSVSGSGTYCNSTNLNASGGNGGTIYWQGTTSNGTSTSFPSSLNNVTNSGTYYYRANNGCGWGQQGSASVVINQGASTSVLISASPSISICSGETVTFTAIPFNGGASPTYQWFRNGIQVSTGSTYSSSLISNGDQIYCAMTSSLSCANPSTINSNTVTMNVGTSASTGVIISASPSLSICNGDNVVFTANPVNGGNSPSFQWYLNGVPIGNNTPTFSTSLLSNGDQVYCTLFSNQTCASPTSINSNMISMTVSPALNTGVTISASPSISICPGENVTFTPSAVNGGSIPSFNWYLNGVQVATASSYSSTSLLTGDEIYCVMNTSLNCANPRSVNSNLISMIVNSAPSPTIIITPFPSATICSGENVVFNSSPINGGASPDYDWYLNGIIVGNGASFSSATLSDGDQINCVMTSSIICASPNTANSNFISMSVIPSVNTGITIFPDMDTTICTGQSLTFNSNVINGGTSPTYEWYVNNILSGTNSTLTSSMFQNGDEVYCKVNSSINCATPSIISSTITTITVDAVVIPTVTILPSDTINICPGDSLQVLASILNGGIMPTYEWYINGILGVNFINDTLELSSVSVNSEIYCVMFSSLNCINTPSSTSNQLQVILQPIVPLEVTIQPSLADTICVGDNILFTAASNNQGSAPTYDWYMNNVFTGSGLTTNITPITNNSYIYCVHSSNSNCVLSQTDTSSLTNIVINPLPIVSLGNDTIIDIGSSYTINAGIGHTSYNWQPNGETTSSIIINTSGTYSVIVFDQYGCSNTDSITIDFSTYVNTLEQSDLFSITPNPSKGKIIVSSNQDLADCKIIVYNVLSQVIYEERILKLNKNSNIEINLNVPKGTYILQVEYDEKYLNKKIVIN